MAARCEAKVCGCSLSKIAGSNPTVSMDVYLLKKIEFLTLPLWFTGIKHILVGIRFYETE
jgi:hypothetical protein